MNAAHRVASTLCVALAMLGCSDGTSTPDAATRDANRLDGALDARTDDVSNGVDVSIVSDADATTGDAMVPDGGGCSDGCATPGFACSEGRCVADCRLRRATACAGTEVCDYSDGRCKEPSSCVVTGGFNACGEEMQCGPGSECTSDGRCVADGRCDGVQCEGLRCYGVSCPCARSPARCEVAPLARLNSAEFVGAIPTNTRPDEGIIDLEFDDVCAAYAVTVISGQDHLRQMTRDGTFRSWGGASNLDMGEVAIRRNPNGTVGTDLGEVALTYACISGCTATTEDAQQGVARLDRASMARPLPNVVPAMVTRGSGPFGNVTIDSGPAGLAYASDSRLYIGNLDSNGEFYRVDLSTRMRTLLHRFASRVNASAIFDSARVLVALENREVFLVRTEGPAAPVRWATLEGTVTSMARDRFTGIVYAELRVGTEPRIVEISADGATVTLFQRPARLGRIAIAPDNHLYHTAVFPDVQWTSAMSPPIQRWPLRPMR